MDKLDSNMIIGGLFLLSEILAMTPLKSNSVFQLFCNVIQRVGGNLGTQNAQRQSNDNG